MTLLANDNGKNEIHDVDKLWDGLHFMLTGVSTSQPIEVDRLSEAIVGVRIFNGDDEDADIISYTRLSDVSDIVTVLKSIDIDQLRSDYNLSKFKKSKIYPSIWRDNQKDSLSDKFIQEHTSLLSFYEKALEKKVNIVVN